VDSLDLDPDLLGLMERVEHFSEGGLEFCFLEEAPLQGASDQESEEAGYHALADPRLGPVADGPGSSGDFSFGTPDPRTRHSLGRTQLKWSRKPGALQVIGLRQSKCGVGPVQIVFDHQVS
jgi:hypothetical protein